MPGSPPTLRDMVKDALDSGQTYTQLAERAIDPETGQKASLALLNDIGLGKVGRMPYDYHLRAAAAALQKPYETVWLAALAEWLPPPEGVRIIVEEDEPENLAEGLRRLDRSITHLLNQLGEDGERRAEGA